MPNIPLGRILARIVSEVLSRRLEMDDIYRIVAHGKPEIHIEASYKDRPIVVKPKYKPNQ